jgi:pentose-5-phosphate-3-epimerase
MKRVKIAAGLCFADYGKIGDQVAEATAAGADYIHAEAADMYVLPDRPLMGGPQVVEGIRPRTHLPIELHCYIRECSVRFIDIVADAGANRIILPMEYFMGGAPLLYFIRRAWERGMEFGIMLDCTSPASFAEEIIHFCQRIHVVTHGIDEKGYWSWRKSQLPMVKKLRTMIDEVKPDVELAVDGGITHENLDELVFAGVDVIEFSRPIFATDVGITDAVKRIREALDEAAAKADL